MKRLVILPLEINKESVKKITYQSQKTKTLLALRDAQNDLNAQKKTKFLAHHFLSLLKNIESIPGTRLVLFYLESWDL